MYTHYLFFLNLSLGSNILFLSLIQKSQNRSALKRHDKLKDLKKRIIILNNILINLQLEQYGEKVEISKKAVQWVDNRIRFREKFTFNGLITLIYSIGFYQQRVIFLLDILDSLLGKLEK